MSLSQLAPINDVELNERESKYRFIDRAGGYAIKTPDRPLVTVELRPRNIRVHSDHRNYGGASTFGLYQFQEMLWTVARNLMIDWKRPEEHQNSRWVGARNWAIEQTRWAICARAYQRWKAHLEKVNSEVKAVQKSIFAATLKHAEIAESDELYKRDYVVKDITNYRAAAVATYHIGDLFEHNRQVKIANSEEAARLKALAEQLGVRVDISIKGTAPTPFDDRAPTVDDYLSALRDWRGLFSSSGEPYGSLNRTLMNLPGGVPSGLLRHLVNIRLKRPVVKRAELIVLLLSVCHFYLKKGHDKVFMYATEDEIRKALKILADHTHNDLEFRRANDLSFLVQYLSDYPGHDHEGNIVGLTRKAIAWHREQRQKEIAGMLEGLGGKTKTALPPVTIPADERIRFLSTVGDIAVEAEKMEHCIASYAYDVVNGHYYLFHVRYRDEEATVQVNGCGGVVQASGPGNKRNGAAVWGKRVLQQWGNEFPEDVKKEHELADVPF